MCDNPRHPQDPVLDKLEHMDEKLNELGKGQAQLMAEVFGTGNTPGLSTKVDEIREGRVTSVRKESAGWSAAVALIVAGVVATLQTLGLLPQSQQ
jgi:hypothetical protein